MRLISALLLLSGCSALPLEPSEEISFQIPIMTWKNEYQIAKSDLQRSGVFCKWPPINGEKLCNVWISNVQYEFTSGEWANSALIKTRFDPPELVEYDPAKDECKTTFKDKVCSPNFEMKATALPTAPADLWGFHRVGYRRLWKKGLRGKGVEIAVIDSGVNPHIDLPTVNFGKALNAITTTRDVSDNGTQHGTHCAGTIASAGKATQTLGGCPECDIIPIRFLSDSGSGKLSDAVKAIDYATANRIPIASNSWGGGGYSEPLRQSIKRYCDSGGLFIVAAGNEANNNDITPRYPASYDESCVISVAAIGPAGRLASFSNFGKGTSIAAPGKAIKSTVGVAGEATWDGTSMATPHVSALAGLLYGRYGAEGLKERILKRAWKNPELKGKTFKAREVRAVKD